jgi:hypothetical protein
MWFYEFPDAEVIDDDIHQIIEACKMNSSLT